jgi:hypothetical protein
MRPVASVRQTNDARMERIMVERKWSDGVTEPQAGSLSNCVGEMEE